MIKVKYIKEIHIIRVENDFEAVKKTVRNVFKSLPNHFHFTYTDQDHDEIIVDCQNDFKVLLQKQQTQNKSRLKLQVVQTLQTSNQMEEGIQFLGDGESYAEILEEKHENVSEQPNYEGNCQQTELFESIQYQSLQESFLISEYIPDEKQSIEEVTIQQQSEKIQIEDQVNAYLRNIYQEIQNEVIKKQEIRTISINQSNQQLAGMIERSLSKLLPKFMKRVSEKTIQTVKKLLNQHPMI